MEETPSLIFKPIEPSYINYEVSAQGQEKRFDERIYTYCIGIMEGKELLIDIYAYRDEQNHLHFQNTDEGYAYILTRTGPESYRVTEGVVESLIWEAKMRMHKELNIPVPKQEKKSEERDR